MPSRFTFLLPSTLARGFEWGIYSRNVRVYVRTCRSRSGMSICTHLHSRARSGTHASRAPKMEVEDREERRFLTMEDGKDSAAGPPQRTCFAELSAERSRRLATLRKRKQQSQCTKEAKRARREQEKVQRKKARCGESSQARYKLCSLSCSIQP